MLQRHCTKCSELKNITEFHRSKRGKYGRVSRCKKCAAEYAREYNQRPEAKAKNCERVKRYYWQDPEAARKKARLWSRSRKGCASRQTWNRSAAGKESYRRYRNSKKGKVADKKSDKNNRKNYPERIKARMAVSHAIEAGKLSPVSGLHCIQCGEPAEQYHHHKGYGEEHWLDVIPLCIQCHITIHQQEGRGLLYKP